MGMKAVQGGILVALLAIAGLLYSIKNQMAPQPQLAAQPLAAQPVDTGVTPAMAAQPAPAAIPYNSFQAAPARPSAARPSPVAPRSSYQTIPRARESAPRVVRQAPVETYETAEVAPAPAPVTTYQSYPTAPAPAPVTPPPPAVQSITVPAGTAIAIRLLDGISTERNRAGDPFQATLEEPLLADGVVVADRGATVMGRVVQATAAGRVSGLSELALELDRIRTLAGEVQIASDTMIRRGETSRGKDAATVGAMAGIGAAIGAIAGGRRGAGIGAGAGGAAGTGTVMSTRGKPVEFEPEARLTFRLRAPITVTMNSDRVRNAGSYDSGRPRLERRN